MSSKCWIKRKSKKKHPDKPYIINVVKNLLDNLADTNKLI